MPFGKMKKIRIAFDVDGTLRCNCTETCRDPNQLSGHATSRQLSELRDDTAGSDENRWDRGARNFVICNYKLFYLIHFI